MCRSQIGSNIAMSMDPRQFSSDSEDEEMTKEMQTEEEEKEEDDTVSSESDDEFAVERTPLVQERPLEVEEEDDEIGDIETNPFVECEQSFKTFKRHLKLWFFGNIIVLIVWTSLFGLSLVLHFKYKESCERANAFGTIGVCLLAFLTIRHLASSILLGSALYHSRKINHQEGFRSAMHSYEDILDTIDFGKSENIQKYVKKMKHNRATKSTIEMGRALDMFNYTKKIAHVSLSPVELPSRRYPAAMTSTPTADNIKKAMRSLSDSYFLNGHLQNETIANVKRSSVHETKNGAYQHYKILIGLCSFDVVPLFSVVVYIMIGAETVDYQPLVPGSRVCGTSLAFNWIVVGIFILHNIVCIFPVYFRLFVNK